MYGSPRIWSDLVVDDGERIGRKRVERLMRQAGLSGPDHQEMAATTIRVPGVRVADDLLDRNFAAGAPNRCWVADITYLRTWEGWLYLVAVQDLYSRRIVGWAMADHLRAELVTDALEMALAHRRPAPGLIWHSDQGSQFVSLAFGQQARAAGIAQSMGSKGDCFDNAVAESFFATLKKELINRRSWPTKAELRTEVFDYIEVFYNRERRHSTLGQRSPADYEKLPLPAHRRRPSRLIKTCPRKRGNSSPPNRELHFAVGGEVSEQVGPAELPLGGVEVVVAAPAVRADDPGEALAEQRPGLEGVAAGRDPETDR